MKHFTNVSMPRKADSHNGDNGNVGLIEKIQGLINDLLPGGKSDE